MKCLSCGSDDVLYRPDLDMEVPVTEPRGGQGMGRKAIWGARLTPAVCMSCGHVALMMSEEERRGFAEVCFGRGAPAVKSPDGDAEKGDPQDRG